MKISREDAQPNMLILLLFSRHESWQCAEIIQDQTCTKLG